MTEEKEGAGFASAATADVAGENDLKAKLVMETARMPWTELQRFYARGQVVRVAPELDLIETAVAVAHDDKAQVQQWLERGLFGEVSPGQAQAWFDRGASLWTLVVAPWVLVQEAREVQEDSVGGLGHPEKSLH